MTRRTILSADRVYRYTLWREWDASLPYVNFIGLNPSTADETVDDPTIRRCMRYAKDWGYGGLAMTNLFALRSTNPSALRSGTGPRAIGENNDLFLSAVAGGAGLIIAAWGVDGSLYDRAAHVCAMLPPLNCLGETKDGQPKHPLYLPKAVKPVPYNSVTPYC